MDIPYHKNRREASIHAKVSYIQECIVKPYDKGPYMIAKKTSRHDKYFRSNMSDPKLAKEFLLKNLPQEVIEKADLDTLKIEKESFIDDHLKLEVNDILFSFDIKGNIQKQKNYVYILLEHMSKSSNMMPYRMTKYVMAIIKTHMEKHKEEKSLPFVYPIVFYTGKNRYVHGTSIYDLFGENRILAEKYMFKDFHLIDLCRLEDTELQKKYHYCLMMVLFMKHVYDKNVMEFFRHYGIMVMKQMDAENETSYVYRTVSYMFQSCEIPEKNEYNKLVTENIASIDEGKMATLAQQYKDEGRVEGRMEGMMEGMAAGKLEGKLEIAKNLLMHKMSIETIKDVTGLSDNEMNIIMKEIAKQKKSK